MKLHTTIAITLISLMSTSYALADKKHAHHNKQQFVDYARVIDSKAIYETVSYNKPVRECHIEEHLVRHPKRTKSPIVLGNIIGNTLASNTNHRHNKHQPAEVKRKRVCQMVDKVHYREELTGYNVRYKYKGRVYHTAMANHPGQRIRIAVNIKPIDA